MNETRVTVHGNVVNEPLTRTGRNGSVFTTFRIGTTPYKRTPDGKYLDSETSFFSVIAFNALAANVGSSLKKGQPVIVEGNLTNKSYVGNDGVSRTSSEIEADHIGHDLKWGRASFMRLSKAAALGLDRTSDEEVRSVLAVMNGVDEGVGFPRPANVDANGEVHDAPVPEAPEFGDPDTDDYATEEPAA